ncbi:MAG: error-prone DNA polymerase [Thermomicrobiales bacterium]
MKPDYVELHLHTAFSFLDGASLPEEMIARAKELGYRALAVTDHDGVYGAMEFAKAADAAGIFPITGAEMTLTDETHLTLLAENYTGYANLCQLITEAHRLPPGAPIQRLTFSADEEEGGLDLSLRGIGKPYPHYRAEERLPRLDPELLATYGEGIILLTGCRLGKLSQLVDAGDLTAARALLQQYVDWLGRDQVFVELQHNKVHGDVQRIRTLIRLADELGLPYVATGNVHYHLPDRHRLQDVLVAIHHRTTLDNSHQLRRPNGEFYLRSAEEMAQLFHPWPEAIATTIRIADRCRAFDLANDLAYVFPDYHPDDGSDPDTHLRKVCYDELYLRYPGDKTEAIRRVEEELHVIAKHKLAGFFLLYRDLLILAAEIALEVRGRKSPRTIANLPPGRGRGSSVSSIVCYLIGLSHVDPIAHNLFFGRFLNEELNSIPDIDLDFPREIRERLIERVYETFGHENAALVCAFSTYKLRSAVRDVGKALGLPLPELDKIAKLSEPRSAKELAGELDRIPGYANRKHAPPWCYLIELSEQLSGFPRHVTQHVGGMVISSSPISRLMPVQPAAMEGRFLAQWDKDSCEDARVVKIDFLALGMLSLVEECLELIAKEGKPPVDLSRIDFEDPAIYEMINEGDTIGVFQIESRAQIQMLPRTRPKKLEDLVVQVAIVRPGPIIGGAVKPYVEHRQRERTSFLPIEPHYDHADLIPVLQETHGVILYQEQVVQVAMALSGFSAGQADSLRRAMTRKRSAEAMLKMWDEFRDGAKARGVPVEIARTVFRKLQGFASYGFPKAHAVAFAVLAYQSCWLKYYYPAEFLCALINNQPMGFYPNHVLINDAKRHGQRVLGPDIELSSLRCTVENGKIRIGIGYVQGMGEETARNVVLERIANGPYRSLADFIRRVPLATEAIENLIMVGAFDRFGIGRREALWMVGLFIPSRNVGMAKKADPGRQLSLPLPVEQDRVELRPMGPWEQMAADYAIIGMSPRYHPLGLLRARLPNHLVTSKQLESLPHGITVELAGLVVCRQRPGTAKGITFLLLEDEVGLINAIVHLDLYLQERTLVRSEPFLIIKGKLQKTQGVINIIAQEIHALEGARTSFHAPKPDSMEDIFDTPATPPRKLEPASHDYR